VLAHATDTQRCPRHCARSGWFERDGMLAKASNNLHLSIIATRLLINQTGLHVFQSTGRLSGSVAKDFCNEGDYLWNMCKCAAMKPKRECTQSTGFLLNVKNRLEALEYD
jgi:hypothetical protein